ncbi:GroES-like protein [Rhizodiscina lignyota]|uniref:GroES-like protein n=1 Tax=Rhizodiscina lignyota TaxID=1504668 RepID=A0A9P4IVD5_9PEZI|nr:GroES-like protein [Rhizodiscina lignyota]
MENKALWVDGVGKESRLGPAAVPEPGEGQLLIQVKAVATQPGEWKLLAGIIPLKLTYPTIIGTALSGVVEKVGTGVSRFAPGDRIAAIATGVLRDDHRFGAYQRFSLVPQELTSKIGNTPFEDGAALSTAYTSMRALFHYLDLERPSGKSHSIKRKEKVLIWGLSSSIGATSAQLAQEAGYTVVGVASARHAELAKTLAVSHFVDRFSATVVQDLEALGPFKAVYAAADSAEDQVKIGRILAAQGGGRFLTTMGVRAGVQLPEGVTGVFIQYLLDFLDPKYKEFTEWVWWDYFEAAFSDGRLKTLPLEVLGGLSKVPEAWNLLRDGKISAKRLIITPGRLNDAQ